MGGIKGIIIDRKMRKMIQGGKEGWKKNMKRRIQEQGKCWRREKSEGTE
jgi:hypothetical protein